MPISTPITVQLIPAAEWPTQAARDPDATAIDATIYRRGAGLWQIVQSAAATGTHSHPLRLRRIDTTATAANPGRHDTMPNGAARREVSLRGDFPYGGLEVYHGADRYRLTVDSTGRDLVLKPDAWVGSGGLDEVARLHRAKEQLTESRDIAIRQLVAAGTTRYKIAQVTGLSEGGVKKIVKRG